MPNRLIRDGMLESEAVLSLPVEARWLYITILLSADDLGLFEATAFRLARKADIRRESADKLLQLIADVDLVRLYQADGKSYGFIPRFRQRLQIKRSKHPHPPIALMADDEDSLNKINDLASKTSVVQQMDSSCASVAQPSEPEPEPKRIPFTSAKLPPCPTQEIVSLYHQTLPELPAVRLMSDKRQKSLSSFWKWVLTSKRSDNTARATNSAEALAWIEAYFKRTRDNDFLMGRLDRIGSHAHWQCDLDFLLTDKGRTHVIEKTREAA